MRKGSEQRAVEEFLGLRGHDFTAVFMAINSLAGIIRSSPHLADCDTVRTLAQILTDPQLSSQRQSLALFAEAAGALQVIFTSSPDPKLADYAIAVLKGGLRSLSGIPHRAVCETLGRLEVTARGPRFDAEQGPGPILDLDWPVLARAHQVGPSPAFCGRSLVADLAGGDRLLVLKLARGEEDLANLVRELNWMEHLGNGHYASPVRFEVPRPITIDGCRLFRLRNLPLALPPPLAATPAPTGIGYTVAGDYFRYPNEHGAGSAEDSSRRLAAIRTGAFLLGRLAGAGIIHTAPIPLFHNRTQQERRPDQGLYDWRQAGRLDAWLDSCLHPNFGLTGLRDFEHFISFAGPSASLYRYLGSHLLSLLLVTASFFRNLDPARRGLEPDGRPVDARNLFARPMLAETVLGIFLDYYQGVVGSPWAGEPPFAVDVLVDRMIEEMGVDRHVVEVLRTPDQQRMSNEEFSRFLLDRGYTREQVARLEKGARELPVHTGPHLGAFNQRISIPELIEATAACAAACMLGRYLKEQRGL